MSPLLHRETKAHGHRRARRQIPPQIRHPITGRNQRANLRTAAGTGWFFLRVIRSVVLSSVLVAAPGSLSNAATDPACATDEVDDEGDVRSIVDGDTIVLADGRRVRLIGIDSPEIDYAGGGVEPFADTARGELTALLTARPHVGIRFDATRSDRYGRLLAHLFLDDGTNVQAWLLERGLGTRLTIPPNVMYLDCYRVTETRARDATRGIWALSEYQPIEATELTKEDGGYRIVTGNVLRVGESRSSIWINIAPRMALRIRREDLTYFEGIEFHRLVGKRIIARGWLYTKNAEIRMRIRHSANLQIADPPS